MCLEGSSSFSFSARGRDSRQRAGAGRERARAYTCAAADPRARCAGATCTQARDLLTAQRRRPDRVERSPLAHANGLGVGTRRAGTGLGGAFSAVLGALGPPALVRVAHVPRRLFELLVLGAG